MDVSVLIPTYGRASKLNACLSGLSEQAGGVSFEVLVGVDGGVGGVNEAPVVPAGLAERTRVIEFAKVGYIPIRKRLVEESRGEVVLSLNDDVLPDAGLVAAHWRVHRERDGVVVTGPAPFCAVAGGTLFDRLIHESSLVFFQPAVVDGGAYETDYRNCFGLNMSASRERIERLGGLPELVDTYGYDDIELAWRLTRGADECVVFEPEARVEHDHRFGSLDVMRREYALGVAARRWADVNPAFCLELFGVDLRDVGVQEELRVAARHGFRDAARGEGYFVGLEGFAWDAVEEGMLETLASGWVTLKRFLWRWGVLDASLGEIRGFESLLDCGECPV